MGETKPNGLSDLIGSLSSWKNYGWFLDSKYLLDHVPAFPPAIPKRNIFSPGIRVFGTKASTTQCGLDGNAPDWSAAQAFPYHKPIRCRLSWVNQMQ